MRLKVLEAPGDRYWGIEKSGGLGLVVNAWNTIQTNRKSLSKLRDFPFFPTRND